MLRLCVIVVFLSASSVLALPRLAYDRVEAFSICSGRFAALHIRQMATKDPRAPETALWLNDFEMLLEATVDAATAEGLPENQPRQWRAHGWSQIAGLLREATAGIDSRESFAAERALEQRLAECRSMLLRG